MIRPCTLFAIACTLVSGPLAAQDTVTLKSAVVTLAAAPAFRAEFEDGLVAKARAHNYNVVPSYDLVPEVTDVEAGDFISRMLANGIGAVLMVSPAAVGPGASLESVRDQVSPAVYANMQTFARRVNRLDGNEVLSVVHLAIYLISADGAEPIGSGAVWLDEPNPSREQGIDRLQNLILANVDGVRPAIRAHLGLPPLAQ